jgi:phospholipase C
MPATTLGSSTPLDSNIPIDTVVVVMMENRSFDSMLGHMNEAFSRTDVEEPPAGASNPDVPVGLADAGLEAGAGPDGGAEAGAPTTHPWMHAPHECFADTDHSWKGAHTEWDNGLNDGFFFQNFGGTDPGSPLYDGGLSSPLFDGERSLWYYDQTDVPFEYSLAENFAFADHYHSALLGPTGPNRDFLMASTSFGLTDNTLPNISTDLTQNVVITDELEQRHTSWAVYSDGTPSLVAVLSIGIVNRYGRTVRFGTSEFLTAAQKGTIPNVAYVDPKVGLADGDPLNDDQHPPADVQVGSQFLQTIVSAVMASPQWPHTALFITWDENGGEYDHLPPPKACAPDSIAPIVTGSDVGTPGDFTQYGFRVPLIVVSPYAKKGYVSHTTYDHTSIARFIEARYKIPALTARDANADPLMDLFDFKNPPANLTPPTLTPPASSQNELTYCSTTYAQ